MEKPGLILQKQNWSSKSSGAWQRVSSCLEVNEISTQPAPEEEEEDQDQNEDQDVPDLTNFVIEELKQYVYL